jgi:hypothetical protein
MNKQLDEVMQRRGELLTKIAGQREQMAEIESQWQARLVLVDKGLAAVRHLRSNPAWVAGAAVLLMFRRHGAFGLAKGAWLMWKRYRSIASLSSRL